MKQWVIVNKENFVENHLVENNKPIILGSGQYLISINKSNEEYFNGYIKFNENDIQNIDKTTNIKTKNRIEEKKYQSPWSEKVLPDGHKIFRRKIGIQSTIAANSLKSIIYTIPYNQVKIDQVEVINCSSLDKIDFKVLDSYNGTYTGYPNYLLNQFGFGVNLKNEYYSDHSNYDADLKLGMQIETIYYNESEFEKTIGINYVLHELK